LNYYTDDSDSNSQKRQLSRVVRSVKNTVVPHPRRDISVTEFWQLLLRRRAAFFLCMIFAIAGAVAVSLILPTRYEGVCRLAVDFDSNALQDVVAKVSGADDDTKLQTQVEVLETSSLAWDVIKRLRLDQRMETAHRKFGIGPAVCVSGSGQDINSISPECRNVLLNEFHARLQVHSVPHTQIIELRYRCKSRELAAQVVNTMAEAFMENGFQTKYQAALRASNWVSGQLNEAKDNAQKAEENFIAYQKKTGIIGTDENHNVLIERLDAINQQLVVAEANRIVREARYRVSLSGDPEALVEITPGSPLQVLHAENASLENQYTQLTTTFGESYPRVQQVKAQLDEAKAELQNAIERSRDTIHSEYEAALKGETQIRKEFEAQKQQAYSTNEAAVQAALLKRDVDASRDLYEQLVKQLNEAGVLAGLRSTNVTIIDPAGIPVDPAEPHRALILMLGIFAGGFLGVTLCFVQEDIDTTILSPKDLTSVGALPALGVVPHMKDLKMHGRPSSLHAPNRARIAALERPEGVVADAYRSLRTALLLSSAGAPPKVMLVTSSLPREGKTTTCINTAVVFAQKDRRVLLVDADLRRADVSRSFDLSRNRGLSAALVGEDPRQFYVQQPDLPGLEILPAGVRPPKPPDLLDSDRMRDLIAIWRKEFDHVIIDAPPVIGLSDAVILATMSDMVILVVRAKQSRRQDFSLAQEILDSVNANIGGAVINDFQMSDQYSHYEKLYGGYFDEKENRNAHEIV
jgi:capsular exopolysaccharide synthesis family protein